MRLALALIIFLATAPASAQDTQPKPASPADVSFQGYGDLNKTCMVWEDGCRTCSRSGDNVSCSNIGIACQPAPIVCKASAADLEKLRNPPKQ